MSRPAAQKQPTAALIENTAIATERCRWCDALNTPHTRACPLGERSKQVQSIGGVPFVLPAAKAVQPPAQITRAELDARDDRIYARDLIRERQHRHGG